MRYIQDWIYRKKLLEIFNVLNKSEFHFNSYIKYNERHLEICNFEKTIFTIKTRIKRNSLYKKAFEFFIKWLCKDNLIDIKR